LEEIVERGVEDDRQKSRCARVGKVWGRAEQKRLVTEGLGEDVQVCPA
jgi:hypothetical protein